MFLIHRSLLLGLACNESATGVKLNLSGVLSSSQAAHVLESCIHGVRCLQSLDLSDNSKAQECRPGESSSTFHTTN